MPNWCYTTIGFKGKAHDVNRLFEKMKEYTTLNNKTETGFVENDFGKGWLGNLAIGFGMSYKEIPCRGSICDLAALETGMPDDPEKEIVRTIETETAWEPCDELFDVIMGNYPEIYYARVAQEPGNELYLNNDREGIMFPQKYAAEFGYEGLEEFNTLKELSETVIRTIIGGEMYEPIRKMPGSFIPGFGNIHNFKALEAKTDRFNDSLGNLGLDDEWEYYVRVHEYKIA